MKKWITQNGHIIYRTLSGSANAYLISSGPSLIMVDTGTTSSFKRLKRNLDAVAGNHAQPDMLVLTHSHYDHCQNAARMKQAFSCKIAMGSEEASYVQEGFTPLPKGTYWITRWLTYLGNRMGAPRFGYEPFLPDLLLKEDQPLDEQYPSIRVIKTQGHTTGSISLIVDQEVAIVGDAMFGIFRNSIFPPFADDLQGMRESWNKLLQTGCRLFLPGHGRPIPRELLRKNTDIHYLV